MSGQEQSLDPRFASQWMSVELAAAAQTPRVNLAFGFSASPSSRPDIPDVLFEGTSLLVGREHVDAITNTGRSNSRNNLREDPERAVRSTRGIDVALLEITDGEPVLDAVPRLEDELDIGRGNGRITPNHLISICGDACLCPADEPRPVVVGPFPAHRQGKAGHGVHVEVIDTGVWAGFNTHGYKWFDEVVADELGSIADVGGDARVGAVAGELRSKTFGANGRIQEYAGHGVFIAGVLRCLAPGVDIQVTNALTFAGCQLEDKLGRQLVAKLQAATGGSDPGPDIISLSAGSKTLGDLPALGLSAFFSALNDPGCTTLLVAAAGNDGNTHPFYPAAAYSVPPLAALLPSEPRAVVSVGALRENLKGRACFSNYGDWVDVYAPGERLINAFPRGEYSYFDPPALSPYGHPRCHYYHPALDLSCTCLTAPQQGSLATFTGYAEWSGTSFSTPYVAALIAAHMSATGQRNARIAAQEVLAAAGSMRDISDNYLLERVLP